MAQLLINLYADASSLDGDGGKLGRLNTLLTECILYSRGEVTKILICEKRSVSAGWWTRSVDVKSQAFQIRKPLQHIFEYSRGAVFSL